MPPAKIAAPPVPPGLSRIEVDIPFMAEFNLAPLLAATAAAPEEDGGWYGLRERFAHLGLAQGFDELLCLPHLQGIETFWYQVETVRKVLKQFRGRVLLADEVGLGKTIEAGMVLKEYLLRGIVDSVLVLTPASLVGQWREEMETKFDIRCATTHDSLLRADPDRFWAEKRLIASIARSGAKTELSMPSTPHRPRNCSISSSSTRHIICATARAEATSWSTGSTSAFCCSCRQRRFRTI